MAILKRNVLLVMFFTLFLAAVSYGQNDNQDSSSDSRMPPPQGDQNQGGQKEHKAPPEFAITACSGKADGDTCQITGPGGAEAGVCAYTPDKKYFACRPKNMKHPQGNQGGPGGPKQGNRGQSGNSTQE